MNTEELTSVFQISIHSVIVAAKSWYAWQNVWRDVKNISSEEISEYNPWNLLLTSVSISEVCV